MLNRWQHDAYFGRHVINDMALQEMGDGTMSTSTLLQTVGSRDAAANRMVAVASSCKPTTPRIAGRFSLGHKTVKHVYSQLKAEYRERQNEYSRFKPRGPNKPRWPIGVGTVSVAHNQI
jgi:hypothetical protein